MDNEPPYKPIKFKTEDHKTIESFARELQEERGTKVYLPPTVLEAITFMRKYRNDPRLQLPLPNNSKGTV